MTKSRRLLVGLIFFLIFTFLHFATMTGTVGFSTALAAFQPRVAPQAGEGAIAKVNDPYEHLNREVFRLNDRLYFHVVKPIAGAYSFLPLGFRRAVQNGFHNLVFPSRFINFVLQGKAMRAGNEVTRFVINSALGVGGLFDVAQTRLGLQNHESDFGQTLGIWGVRPGAFLMIPALGPSDERDLVGYAVDSVTDPLFWLPGAWWISIPPQVGREVNNASLKIGEYEAFKKASLDPYAAMRNGYVQYRAHACIKD